MLGRSQRFFRAMTWIGGTSCLLILASWFWSTRYSAMYLRDDWYINLISGVLRFEQSPSVTVAIAQRNYFLASSQRANGTPPPRVYSIWSVIKIPEGLTITFGFHGCSVRWDTLTHVVLVPVWIVFLAVLTVTLLFWRSSRWGRQRGHCVECGYCLTGNSSGVCPECGTAVVGNGVLPASIT
jgi:hypothetical protein